MPHRIISHCLMALAGVFLCFSATAANLGPRVELFKVDKIQIVGNKKVEDEAILEKIHTKIGSTIDNYTVRKDIELLYGMKYFNEVEFHHEKIKKDNVLKIVVKEKPIVSRISFWGNDELDNDELMKQMQTKEFSILDVNTIKNDVKSMEKYYEEKGFYLANVAYELKSIDPENVEVLFRVKEYDKVRVKKIIFLGNSAFNDDELKSVISTKEEHLFSFLDGSGNFKEFNFQADIEMLRYFYRNKGHLQINIASPEITVSEDKKWVFITIKISEGPEFKINSINYQGEMLFGDAELKKATSLKVDDVYSEEKLRADIQSLTELYQDKGFAFANVLRTIRLVPGENKVDVDFSFEKGKIARFGKITIKGNDRTRDKVIRRELEIKEGDKFSGTNLRLSKENVNRLGFFEPGSVVFNTVSPPGTDDVLDVEISVKERNTGQIQMGAGYSTSTKFFVQASVSQNNFRGYGQNLTFSTSLASEDQTFNLGFTDPYFMDSKWTAGGDVFRTSNSQSDAYEYKKTGFDMRIGYPIFKYTRLFATYKLEDTKIEDIESPDEIDEELENGISSSIRFTLRRDKRNNSFEPTDGTYLSASSEFAGLGGDKKWELLEFDARYYKRIWGDLVFRSRFYTAKLFEIDGQEIPTTEKFTLGGSRNLRGFDYEDIGKIVHGYDPDGPEGNTDLRINKGGLHTIYTSLEFEHPLAREAGLKWVVFTDIGNVYDDYMGKGGDFKLYGDYGFGFRWFSPIGVLRFEFAKAFKPVEDGTDDFKFNFDIGPYF